MKLRGGGKQGWVVLMDHDGSEQKLYEQNMELIGIVETENTDPDVLLQASRA